jgi:hypothetical protein
VGSASPIDTDRSRPADRAARRVRRCVVAVAMAGLLAGCVTNPVGRVADAGAFADKAEHTVADARSSVGTVRLAVDAELTGRSYRAYTAQVVDDAVTTLMTAQDTFESVVPPDESSAALSARVLDAVTGARRALVEMRSALAGDDAAVSAALPALGPAGDALDALDEELRG